MQINNIKMNMGTVLGGIYFLIVFICVFMGNYIIDFVNSDTDLIVETQKSSGALANSLLAIEKVTLDTKILESDYLQTVNIIPSFPTDAKTLSNFGKANPFIGTFSVVSSEAPVNASTTVGAVIYSNQREANDGQSIRPVSTNRLQGTTNRRR